MKQTISSFLILFIVLIIFSACSKKGSNPGPQNTPTLTITSLSVNSGAYNTSVTINGTDFSSTIANNQVFFNGKAAVVTAATSTALTVTVPLGAGTGKVSISVNNGSPVIGPVFTYQLSEVVTTIAGSGKQGSANGLASVASFNVPWGIAIDSMKNLYVSDYLGLLVRKITPGGSVSTFASGFPNPAEIAIDGSGNLYVADGSWVDKITPNGTVSQVFKQGGDITGVAVDAAGNLYASDVKKNVILKIDPLGNSSVFAGSGVTGKADGKGNLASFYGPVSIAFDASDNLYVVDESNNLIRKITPDGTVSTIAGDGSIGAANGKGANASFNDPTGIAVDHAGNIYIGDYSNNIIRKIAPDGTVSTFAGTGTAGSGNGAAATASFYAPQDVTLDASGNLCVADSNNNLIREISLQ